MALGRLLSQIGTGFTLFYAPIFFVNDVNLSATAVGTAIGSGSVSGILGRFLGGTLTDSPAYGRKKTLILSAIVSTLADIILAFTENLGMLFAGNLLMGLGVGLYWPATEAVVADLSTPEQRNEAFAVTRLADSLGLSFGVILGGAWLESGGSYRLLFLLDGASFLIFVLIIAAFIPETAKKSDFQGLAGWGIAFRDRAFSIYLLVNILFTTYLAQIQTTLPLYLKNELMGGGFSSKIISGLFTWHIVVTALIQLPVARFLNRFSRIRGLMISLLLWQSGFILIWLTGIVEYKALFPAIMALGILGIATAAYTPSAASLVVELAPPNLWGVYLSLNSQCWAIGYLIGPPLGGVALDGGNYVIYFFWLSIAASVWLGLGLLKYMERSIGERL